MEAGRWLSTNEIRERYPLGRTRLYSILEDGSLKSVRWGRKYLVRESDLESFLEESKHCFDRN